MEKHLKISVSHIEMKGLLIEEHTPNLNEMYKQYFHQNTKDLHVHVLSY